MSDGLPQMTFRTIRALGVFVLFTTSVWPQQKMSSVDRARAQDMLQVVAGEVRKHYYDPKFHGENWDAKVSEAKQRINKETSMNMAMSHIAAALLSLNDSHTFFVPPQHSTRIDYGWQYQMVGQRCFITRVRPNSDAEAKGVKPGDEVLTLNGYRPNRENLWEMQYAYSVLRPQGVMRLDLLTAADGQRRQLDVVAKLRQGKRVTDLTGGGAANDIWDLIRQAETEERLMRIRHAEYGDRLFVMKVPQFSFSDSEMDAVINKARKYPNLVIDLRGNPGGSAEALKYLVSRTFGKEIKIGDRVGRRETKPELAKASSNSYSGNLVVLIDSQSGSAAELFARLVQIEKRGVAIGDQSSGSVMEARRYDEKLGTDVMIFFGVSVTEWDLIMADGKSLERTGVTPDELLLPSAKDLANSRDPVLARAAELAGVKLSAEDAGKVFPYEWTPE